MDEIRFEALDRAKHQRDGFSCGKPSLDDFLRSFVNQYEKRKLGRTIVAVRPEDPHVLGYYTLTSSSLPFKNLPPKMAKKLPKHPIPVVLLARLAVDQSMHGQGLGRELLMDALRRILEVSKSLGIHAVEVDAIDEAAKTFYEKFGFTPLLDENLHFCLPLATIEEEFFGS
jgi:GNAT superfamily N-acetyltransferase